MVWPDYDEKGTCLTGYKGILCTTCDLEYSRTGNYKCQRCPDPT